MNKFEYIVISGGGPRVFSFCGAFEQLVSVMHAKHNKNWLNDCVKGGGGTSIGAFVVFSVLSGCRIQRLFQIIKQARLWKPECMLSNIQWTNLQSSGGICNHNLLYELIYSVMDELELSREITFSEWNQKFGKTLVMNTTCLDNHKIQYFSDRWTPRVKIAEALVMSMCFPSLFQPYVFRGKSYVDGGVACNYIAHLFPPESTIGIAHFNSQYIENCNEAPKSISQKLRLDMNFVEQGGEDFESESRNIVSTVLDVMDSMSWYLQAHQFLKLDSCLQKNTICVFPAHIISYNSIMLLDERKMNNMYIYGSMKTLWHFYGECWSLTLAAQFVEDLASYVNVNRLVQNELNLSHNSFSGNQHSATSESNFENSGCEDSDENSGENKYSEDNDENSDDNESIESENSDENSESENEL